MRQREMLVLCGGSNVMDRVSPQHPKRWFDYFPVADSLTHGCDGRARTQNRQHGAESAPQTRTQIEERQIA